jgi:ABC-2 type transport system permease protein
MPIYDQGYRHFEGALAAPSRRFVTITAAGVRLALKRKATWVALLLASIPFFVMLVIIWIRSAAQQGSDALDPAIAGAAREVLSVDGARFWQAFFLPHCRFIAPLLALLIGSGLIANDRRTNALEIYFSRPITKLDYLLGKLGIVLLFVLFITLGQGVLLYVFHVASQGTLAFVVESADLLLAIVVSSVVITVPMCAGILALSSLTTSARFAGLAWFGLLMITGAAGGILEGITGTQKYWGISLIANVEQVCTRILLDDPELGFPWQLALGILAGVVLLSAAVLWFRTRPVEVVS